MEMLVGLPVAGAPSCQTLRSITELSCKLLQEFLSLERQWRKMMCSFPHLGVWLINTVFPENISQKKFMLVVMFFLPWNSKEPIKNNNNKLSQMP